VIAGDQLDVWEAIQTRRSIRAYQPDQIPDDVLNRILEAGRLSPSAVNRQPWHFVIVRDENMRSKLAKNARFGSFIKESPVVIVACGDPESSPNWYIVDTSIAVQQMVLMATAEGVGSCWIGSMDKSEVSELLSIPDKWEVVAMLTLGYPRKKIDLGAKIIGAKTRKSLEDITSGELFGSPFS
jgi:nitroreductase